MKIAAACMMIVFSFPILGQYGIDLAIQLQGYPTGAIPGFTVDQSVTDRSAIHLRVGYNIVRHGDAGEHEDERGGGLGFSLGYLQYFSNQQNWFIVLKSDLWFNDVDWKDQIGTGNEISGTSKVKVLQPTLEIGYRFGLQGDFFFRPSLALGAEINVDTRGSDVGEGLILLAGISIGKRL